MKEVTGPFNTRELASLRRPAEIYHIWRDGGQHWRYTSGDVNVTYNGNVFTPASIKRGPISISAKLEVTTMEVMSAAITDPAATFIASNPVEPLWIEVIKVHRSNTDNGIVVFIGQIKSVAFKGVQASARCVGFENFLTQPVPIHRYMPSCNNRLFDTKCALVASSYKTTTTVVAVDALTFTSADFDALADGYFVRGNFVWGEHARMITTHVGSQIQIRYPIGGITSGVTVDAYAGCDLDPLTCRDRFDNMINFFGHPYIPKDNPVTKF